MNSHQDQQQNQPPQQVATMDQTSNTSSTTNTTNSTSTSSRKKSPARQRFADCALIEIIHLHDCLRGALAQINDDVQVLVHSAACINSDTYTNSIANGNSNTENSNTSSNCSSTSSSNSTSSSISTTSSPTSQNQTSLASTMASSTKNEILKPSPFSSLTSLSSTITSTFDIDKASDIANSVASRFHLVWSVFQAHSGAEDEFIWPALKMKLHSKKFNPTTTSSSATSSTPSNPSATLASSPSKKGSKKCGCESLFEQEIEQEIYEEDHEIEQTMFKQIHSTLRRLQGSFRLHAHVVNALQNNNSNTSSSTLSTTINIQTDEASCLAIIKNVIHQLQEQTEHLHLHLSQHLEKEETQCLPMVQRHLSNEEISNLVGNIMGQRSADLMTKILNLAVCALPRDERQDMVKHMKKAMVGTFFEKWLSRGGWEEMQGSSGSGSSITDRQRQMMDQSAHSLNNNNKNFLTNINSSNSNRSSRNQSSDNDDASCNNSERISIPTQIGDSSATCDSSMKRSRESDHDSDLMDLPPAKRAARHHNDTRLRFPAKYFVRKNKSKRVSLIWSSEKGSSKEVCAKVPQFTVSELTPTYHFNEKTGGMVLGCEHYQRGCKLRHPKTGELFTCRLCCDEVREKYRYGDEALPQLDRYNVKEVMCMKCGSLQPSGKNCTNKNCEVYGKPFAKHFCDICHLYDNSGTDIYHCPFCNVCRKGKGLGIDFRHCMRCNACVSINEPHKCITQRLQGNCPICHEAMFESTEPLRGLKCGHVMHLSCFNEYMARSSLGKLNCPLCKVSFGDMRG